MHDIVAQPSVTLKIGDNMEYVTQQSKAHPLIWQAGAVHTS
jgi:hypothetical protein